MGESITRLITSLALASVSLSAAAQLPFSTGPAGGNQPLSTLQPSLGLNYIIRTNGTFDRLGEIQLFGGNFAPAGFKIANGQELQIAQFDPLFTLIGTSFGGDGNTTFALPNLSGRTAIGYGPATTGTNFQYADNHGFEQVTLGQNHLPQHAHSTPPHVTPNAQTLSAGGSQPFNNIQPSLALGHRIVTQGGAFPSRDVPHEGPEPFLGQIILSAVADNTFLPNGQTPTNGQLLPINNNQAVFSLLGTNFGGNGQVNFALPDQRGRALTHAGEAGRLSVGQISGNESVFLSPAQMPSHDHNLTPAAPLPLQTGTTGGDQPFDNHQPTLKANYIIALQGIFPPRDDPNDPNQQPLGTAPFIGQIAMFAGNFAPAGWALADGQLIPIRDNTALFAILGTTFGGDGKNTFALPNLVDHIPVGFGQGQGLSDWQLGEIRGESSTTLLESQMPTHSHNYIPEPATLSLLTIPTLLLLRRHKR